MKAGKFIMLREVIDDLLKIHQIKVKTVGDSSEANDWLVEYIPDLIICDLFLPAVSGIQWLNSVSEDLVANKSSIILLSADHVRTHDMLVGSPIQPLVKHQLKKPFKNDELVRLIRFFRPNS